MNTKILNIFLLFWVFITPLNSNAENEVSFKKRDVKIKGAADHYLVKRYPGSVIFDYAYTKSKEHSLVLGAISFEELDEPEDSGYQANEIEVIKGDVTRIVYDYLESSSVTSIMKSTQEKLKKSGFKERFYCAKSACGEAVGWRAFLYPQLNDENAAQEYYVAEKDNTIVSFYVTDIAGQARSVLDVIQLDNQKNNKQNAAAFNIFFDLNRSDFNIKQLEKVKQKLEQAKQKNFSIRVEGYADASGDINKNKQLSQSRAKEVKKQIIKLVGFSSDKIQSIGNGIIKRELTGTTSKNIKESAYDRRADVFFITAS